MDDRYEEAMVDSVYLFVIGFVAGLDVALLAWAISRARGRRRTSVYASDIVEVLETQTVIDLRNAAEREILRRRAGVAVSE